MSGKQDKRLRRAARGLAVTLEQGGTIKISERRLVGKEHFGPPAANFSSVAETAEASGNVEEPRPYAVTALNDPHTYRGIVRHLKKGMKGGKVNLPHQR